MREITLSAGRVALVDDEDFQRLSGRKWTACRCGVKTYAVRRRSSVEVRAKPGPVKVYMHREILQPGPGFEVDHVNGDGLDNRRANLRECVRTQNNANHGLGRLNASGFKGVSWDAANRRWRTSISAAGVTRNLGRYDRPEDAARAYDRAAVATFGDFARLNFPEGA